MNVLIIDSGFSSHTRINNNNFYVTGFKNQYNILDVVDNVGHGTAISYLISKDNLDDVNIFILKAFNEEGECCIEDISDALSYILKNDVMFDVINMSFGITAVEDYSQIEELENICCQLTQHGSILVSAYDNDGAISYPAFFECVLGVDSSLIASKRTEYEYIYNSCINILGYGKAQTIPWENNTNTIGEGNSFACANVTNVIIHMLKEGVDKRRIREELERRAIKKQEFDLYQKPNIRPKWIKGTNAIVLPVSKENNSLLAFEELLDFNIIDIYDFKQKGNVGKETTDLIKYKDIKRRTIKNYDDIDWKDSRFNTVIMGHMGELAILLKRNIICEIINKCKEEGKYLYAYDDLEKMENVFIEKEDDNIFSPNIKRKYIPKGRYGKLFNINIPVLAVVGTSSSQGKFTVQLTIRKKLIENGYKVGQIGSEPSSYCFGIDYTFPVGYNSSVYTTGYENILLINSFIHEIERQGKDLCLLGTQANTIPFGYSNLKNFPLFQVEMLYGAIPDKFILVVNAHDDFDYIYRTIQYIEASVASNCIAIVIYPIIKRSLVGSVVINENIDQTARYEEIKKQLTAFTKIPVIDFGDLLTTNIIVDIIVDAFSS